MCAHVNQAAQEERGERRRGRGGGRCGGEGALCCWENVPRPIRNRPTRSPATRSRQRNFFWPDAVSSGAPPFPCAFVRACPPPIHNAGRVDLVGGASVAVVVDAPHVVEPALQRGLPCDAGSGGGQPPAGAMRRRRRAAFPAHALVRSVQRGKACIRSIETEPRSRKGAPLRARLAIASGSRQAGDTPRGLESRPGIARARRMGTAQIGIEPARALRTAAAPALGDGRRRARSSPPLLRGSASSPPPGRIVRDVADGGSGNGDTAPR